MSSVIDLASEIINDDPSNVQSLIRLIVNVSDHPRDPLKAAHRYEVLKFLISRTPEFDSHCEAYLKEIEDEMNPKSDSPMMLSAGASH